MGAPRLFASAKECDRPLADVPIKYRQHRTIERGLVAIGD